MRKRVQSQPDQFKATMSDGYSYGQCSRKRVQQLKNVKSRVYLG